jgi:pantoate--beta-alanine ligase
MQRLALRWRRAGMRVGFVPTMGYLHAGHLSLVQRARRLVGPKGKVVVSIYVNPTQFGPAEDFSHYPRDLKRDARLCRREGVDVIFAPADSQMYPRGGGADFSTFVVEERLARLMEGQSRPTHFRGVTTVVAKLFNIVQPDLAVFGAKDYQQAAIVQRMVRDLDFPVKIVVAPILREPGGLAMSSRNKYLTGDLRGQAVALWRSLQQARAAVRKAGRAIPAARLRAELKRFIERASAARLDYVEFFEPNTLVPVSKVKRGVHMALAVFIGKTRLIDNGRL